jgi:hypothetical protein
MKDAVKLCIEMVLTHVLHTIDAIRSGHLTNGSPKNYNIALILSFILPCFLT